MDFRRPVLSDREAVRDSVMEAGYTGSDASFGNIFLLQEKYDTLITFDGNLLIRYYNGEKSRRGYTFPLGKGNIKKTVFDIIQDSEKSGRPLEFCFVDEKQKEQLENIFKEQITFTKDRGDSDYIYSLEALSALQGKQYQKKRNHISRFSRTYSDFELRSITENNISDAFKIEEQWLSEQNDDENSSDRSEISSRNLEYSCIKTSLEHFDELGLRGAVLYVYGRPAAMTVASEIIPDVWDIHFEKAVGEYADNGAYSVINKLFAGSLGNTGLINREEDINIEGLRKAKLSYHPQIIFDKYHASVNIKG